MLLEDAYNDVPDPDLDSTSFEEIQSVGRAKTAAGQLAAMRKLGGGLKLAYKLMTTALQEHSKILQTVTRSCWTWYTKQVHNVKSPKQGLQDAFALAQGNWMREKHLGNLIHDSFESHANLDYMGVSCTCPDKARKVFFLAARLLGNRCWSMAVRHHGPPDIYVGLLSSSQTKREWAISRLKRDWQRMVWLENQRASNSAAMDLWKDLIAGKNNVVRLMFCAFERDQFRASSAQGCRLLHAMLHVLPDNKIVEDGHNEVRKDSKRTGLQKKRTQFRMQHVLQHTRVFEKRDIRHAAAVPREVFIREYKDIIAERYGHRFNSRKHRMKKEWYQILGTKRWKTISEVILRADVAAWEWLQTGHALASAEAAVSLHVAKFSKLAQPEMLLRRLSDKKSFLCLGSAVWASLLWPTEELGIWNDELHALRLDHRAAAEFAHIVNPDDWEELPFEAQRHELAIAQPHGLVLLQSKPG